MLLSRVQSGVPRLNRVLPLAFHKCTKQIRMNKQIGMICSGPIRCECVFKVLENVFSVVI